MNKKNLGLKKILKNPPKTKEKTFTTWLCDNCGNRPPTEAEKCGQCGLLPSGCDPLVGQQMRSYQIHRRVAGGLLNIVYQATDIHSGRSFALKRVPVKIANALDKERQLHSLVRKWKHFKHPSAPSINDIFETKEGDLYWVSPWLEGKPLNELLHSHRSGLPFEQAIALMNQLCDLLQKYHDLGLIHAQLRNEQLFIQEQNGVCRLKLSDLGWGTLIGQHFQRTQDQDEGTLRALRYLAPEQLLPEIEQIDVRADIYASAAIFFHMLTGRPPYPSREREELYRQHLYAPPPRLNMATPRRKYSPKLENILRCAMAKQPQDRYASIRSFSESLQSLEQQTATRPKSHSTKKNKKKTKESVTLSLPSIESQINTPIQAKETPLSSLYLGKDSFQPKQLIAFFCLLGLGLLIWSML